jgi:hypothetical protein
MSDYERKTGLVNRMYFPASVFTAEEQELYIWTELEGNYKEEFYENCIKDVYYDRYLIVGDTWFEVLSVENLDIDDSYCNISEVSNGVYKFDTMFYNGGTCLSEMLEEGLEGVL